jgi:hypothetical protein
VKRSSSSSTSWKLVKDRDHRSAWEGMIRRIRLSQAWLSQRFMTHGRGIRK